ncbi:MULTISPECIES: hypothetical protein [unclassified Cryobacterium]|uniref:hypothetical protein n=1 Tax=unclassified Cryobacterium TaxID=2649013 RepID=UPI001446D06C|nr:MULTISPECIES: hypothetical protein [unclassified Cryobacterium]
MFKPARKLTTVTAAILLSGGMVFSLSGCFSNPLENLVEDGLGVNVEDSGSSIPGDFPKAVPLYDGPVKEGSSLKMGDVKTWTVVIGVSGLEAGAKIEADLKAAGIDGMLIQDDKAASGVFGNDDYGVMFTVENADGGWQVSYLVTEGGKTE